MKVEWTEGDIRAGRIVGKPAVTERLMIGYIPMDHNFMTLNSLADGQVQRIGTKQDVANRLNQYDYQPAELLDAV